MSIDRFWILIARKLSGESSVEEMRELEELLRTHPDLHFSVEIISNLWNQLPVVPEKELDNTYSRHIDRLKSMGIQLQTEGSKVEGDMPFFIEGSRKNRPLKVLAIAASVILLLTAGFSFLYFKKNKSSGSVADKAADFAITTTTKNGSRTDIQLPDGSKVWLNSGSSLTYDKTFGKEIREVVLSGEAFFDVVRDADKPFLIHTASMDIKVLGTRFNVKSYDNDKLSEASLIHGSIEISLKKRGSEKILLKPNEKIVVMNERLAKDTTLSPTRNNSSEPIIAVRKINYTPLDSTIVETSWVDHKLIFRDESFEEIAVSMERWYGIPVQFQDPSFKNMRFTGTFTNETIQQALEALQITASFHYTIRNNIITITK